MPRRDVGPQHAPPAGSDWEWIEQQRVEMKMPMSVFSAWCGLAPSAYGKIGQRPNWNAELDSLEQIKAKLATAGRRPPQDRRLPALPAELSTAGKQALTLLMFQRMLDVDAAERAVRAAAVFDPDAGPARLHDLATRLLDGEPGVELSFGEDGVARGGSLAAVRTAESTLPPTVGKRPRASQKGANLRPRSGKNTR